MKYGVGIDISKGKSTVAILSIEGEVIEEPFEINHDIEGLNLLEEKIKDIPKEDLKIVMEETGTYHLPVFLLPIHIVLLELIIDPTASIIFERLTPDNNVMKEKPRKINDPIISSSVVVKCILQGVAIFIGFFGSYYHLIQNEMDPVFSVTFSFTVLVLSNIFVVYVLQSNEFAIKNMIIDLKDKVIAFINFVIITMLLFIIYIPFLQKIVGTTPLTLKELLCAVLISIIVTLPFDLLK